LRSIDRPVRSYVRSARYKKPLSSIEANLITVRRADAAADDVYSRNSVVGKRVKIAILVSCNCLPGSLLENLGSDFEQKSRHLFVHLGK
jgi:hypothetical protein